MPKAGILRHHGSIPLELPGYRAVCNPEAEMDTPDLKYWCECGLKSVALELASFLPKFVSQQWSGAQVFGEKKTDSLTIFEDGDLWFRFDLRDPNLGLIGRVAEMATRHELLWVSSVAGCPMVPNFKLILEDVMQSDAYRFCKGPKDYLLSLPKEARFQL